MNDTETSFINLPELSRDEKLEIWVRRKEISYQILAAVAGISKSVFSRRLSEGALTSYQHKNLVDYGVPPELLPPAIDKRRGPKPKIEIPASID